MLCGAGFKIKDLFELGLGGYVTIYQVEKCKGQLSEENSMNKSPITFKELGYSGNDIFRNGLRGSVTAN